jgi:hypothetical protein
MDEQIAEEFLHLAGVKPLQRLLFRVDAELAE